MQKLCLSSLLFAVLASFSMAATAAEAQKNRKRQTGCRAGGAGYRGQSEYRRCCNTAA